MYNLKNQKIDFEFKPQYIKEEVHNGKLQRSRTEVGDLIMNIVGPPLGKLAIIPSSLPQCNFNQAAVLIRPILHKESIVSFLFYYLSEMSEINSIQTRGNAGQDNISLTQCLNIRVPMPPLNEQIRIVAEIERWYSLIVEIESNCQDLQKKIEQTKAKILELAIHGRLVPQDLDDEPASELLKRIAPNAIPCDTSHYGNIPQGWCICKLKQVTTIARGGSPRPIKSYITTAKNGVNWIKIGDAEKGGKYINHTEQRIIPEGVNRSRFVKKGDFLLSNSMSFGRPYILNIDGCIHDGWLVISPTDNVYDKNFLYYLLSSQYAYNQFVEQASGTAVSNLNIDRVANALFPIPPINEQLRIVQQVEQIIGVLDRIATKLYF